MVSMKTHSQIVKEAAAPEVVAKVCGVSVHTVRSWIQRNSIPADKWVDLTRANWTTLEALAQAAAAKRPEQDAA